MPTTLISIDNKFSVDSNGSGYFQSGIRSSGDIYIKNNLVVTGAVVRPSETGVFYLSSNPSGYVTGDFVTAAETGNFVTTSQTGNLTGSFYPLSSNPSGYLTTNTILNVSGLGTGTGINCSIPSFTVNIGANRTFSFNTLPASGFMTYVTVRIRNTGAAPATPTFTSGLFVNNVSEIATGKYGVYTFAAWGDGVILGTEAKSF